MIRAIERTRMGQGNLCGHRAGLRSYPAGRCNDHCLTARKRTHPRRGNYSAPSDLDFACLGARLRDLARKSAPQWARPSGKTLPPRPVCTKALQQRLQHLLDTSTAEAQVAEAAGSRLDDEPPMCSIGEVLRKQPPRSDHRCQQPEANQQWKCATPLYPGATATKQHAYSSKPAQ